MKHSKSILFSTILAVVLGLCAGISGALAASPVETGGGVEVGFSPDGSGEALVLHTIESAHSSIRLAAYSFTAARVAHALVQAKKRGVDVAVVVDFKNNMEDDRSGKGRAVLNLLVNAGIPTRTVSVYPIQHSKYAVIDGETVQTGSYNYSVAAARYNSENVLVILNHPALAQQYLNNWRQLYDAGQAYASTY